MARYEHLPVFKKAMDMSVYLEEIVRKFSLRDAMRKVIFSLLLLVLLSRGVAMAALVDNGDTVTDTATGLMWQKATAPGIYSWQQALAYAETLTLAGYTDWRLPNRNELQSLVDYSHYNPSIDPLLAPHTVSSGYWSSTTYAYYTNSAWHVDFSSDGISDDNKLNSHYVRAVRAGQSGIPPTITVITPKSESWQAGKTKTITWTDTISENVKIWLIKGGQKVRDITTSTASNGSFSWSIPEDIVAGDDYQIGIQSVSNPAVVGYSDGNFKILSPRTFSAKALEILNFLKRLPNRTNKRVISGQFAGYSNITGKCGDYENKDFKFCYDRHVKDLAYQTGKYVAMIGADYGNIPWELSDTEMNEQRLDANKNLLKEYFINNGLITISWHAMKRESPFCENSSSKPELCEKAVVKSAFTKLANDLTKNVDSLETRKWKASLSAVADALEYLKDQRVVVLWRPFHEMNGDWFWWGNQETNPFIMIWQHMFEYFTGERGLDNLLWVYSVAHHKGMIKEYYPGSDYVDILGLDVYNLNPPSFKLDGSVILQGYTEMEELGKVSGKPIGLTEFGRGCGDKDTCNIDYKGEFTNLQLINFIRTTYPNIVFFQVWHSPWAIVSNDEADYLLYDPWVITREMMNSLINDCSGDVVVLPQNMIFFSGNIYNCTATTSITAGTGVTVQSGAIVNFKAPKINLQPGFRVENGAVFSAKP